MIESHYPFGITPEKMTDFDKKQSEGGVINHPLRDIKKETFWDFMTSQDCDDNEIFEPNAIAALGR